MEFLIINPIRLIVSTIDIPGIGVPRVDDNVGGSRTSIYVSVAAVVLFILVLVAWSRTRNRLEIDAEEASYRVLQKHLSARRAVESYQALSLWLSVFAGEQSVRMWLRAQRNESLSFELEKLITDQFAGSSQADYVLISKSVAEIRRRNLNILDENSLPQLNPV